jgi:hypothetical protein
MIVRILLGIALLAAVPAWAVTVISPLTVTVQAPPESGDFGTCSPLITHRIPTPPTTAVKIYPGAEFRLLMQPVVGDIPVIEVEGIYFFTENGYSRIPITAATSVMAGTINIWIPAEQTAAMATWRGWLNAHVITASGAAIWLPIDYEFYPTVTRIP